MRAANQPPSHAAAPAAKFLAAATVYPASASRVTSPPLCDGAYRNSDLKNNNNDNALVVVIINININYNIITKNYRPVDIYFSSQSLSS